MAPYLFKKLVMFKMLIACSAIISVCAEIIQYILVVGVFDVDDILFNIAGSVVGFYFGKLSLIDKNS